MKLIYKISIGILFIAAVFVIACNNKDVKELNFDKENISVNVNETELLLKFFKQTGNIINKKEMPPLVTVDEVFENLNNYLLIDIRDNQDYVTGHVDGAINVKNEDLFNFLSDSISASSYEKIVFICYSGQSASYDAMLFRLLGYGNVYSMKFGMSAVDPSTAGKKWWSRISDKYSGKLEIKENPKRQKGDYPVLNTGEKSAYKILQSRVKQLLLKSNFGISADEVFANPEKYYIINYWPEEQYKKGHIPGSIQYTPKNELIAESELSTLPVDKPIVLYCYTGQHTAFVTAYLQVLGYDAYSILFGANGFMHNKMISANIGNAYNKAENFQIYPLVKGDLPSIKKESGSVDNSASENTNTNPVVPIIKKKEKKSGGGGC